VGWPEVVVDFVAAAALPAIFLWSAIAHLGNVCQIHSTVLIVFDISFSLRCCFFFFVVVVAAASFFSRLSSARSLSLLLREAFSGFFLVFLLGERQCQTHVQLTTWMHCSLAHWRKYSSRQNISSKDNYLQLWSMISEFSVYITLIIIL